MRAVALALLLAGCASSIPLGERVYADVQCMNAMLENGLIVYMAKESDNKATAIDVANTVLQNDVPEKVMGACKGTLDQVGKDVQQLIAKRKAAPKSP